MSSFGSVIATTALAQLLPQNLTRIGVMIKSKRSNTDTIFIAPAFTGTATTAYMMPLEPGEAVFLGTTYPEIMAPEFNAAINVVANSGAQDVRFIDF